MRIRASQITAINSEANTFLITILIHRVIVSSFKSVDQEVGVLAGWLLSSVAGLQVAVNFNTESVFAFFKGSTPELCLVITSSLADEVSQSVGILNWRRYLDRARSGVVAASTLVGGGVLIIYYSSRNSPVVV